MQGICFIFGVEGWVIVKLPSSPGSASDDQLSLYRCFSYKLFNTTIQHAQYQQTRVKHQSNVLSELHDTLLYICYVYCQNHWSTLCIGIQFEALVNAVPGFQYHAKAINIHKVTTFMISAFTSRQHCINMFSLIILIKNNPKMFSTRSLNQLSTMYTSSYHWSRSLS